MAYMWHRDNQVCWTLPRLLVASDFRSGSCDYFVDLRCHKQYSGCSPEFNICLLSFPNSRFRLKLHRDSWNDHQKSCQKQGGLLAEFPNHFEEAMLDFFPMFNMFLNQNMTLPDSCLKQCRVFIGAKLIESKKSYRWIRNPLHLPVTWNLPFTVRNTFKRAFHPHISFGISLNSTRTYEVEDWEFSGLALCECDA